MRFVALLRAVNVGGRRPIPMAALRTSLTALGHASVKTYLQSGNAVFDTSVEDAEKIASDIQAQLERDFGFDVEVLVLPAEKIARVVSANPFASVGDVDERWLHATFLFDRVEPAEFAKLALPAAEGERAELVGGVVYLYLPYGYGRTKLGNAYFERALGTAATTRNWRTVWALAELSESGEPPEP